MSAPQSNCSWHPNGRALIGIYVVSRRLDVRGTTVMETWPGSRYGQRLLLAVLGHSSEHNIWLAQKYQSGPYHAVVALRSVTGASSSDGVHRYDSKLIKFSMLRRRFELEKADGYRPNSAVRLCGGTNFYVTVKFPRQRL